MNGVTIRNARAGELEALRAIEMDAVAALIDAGVPFSGEPHPLSSEQLAAYLADGLLIVAAGAEDTPVGFVAAEEIGGMLYIAEVDVIRRLQGKGIGRSLMQAAIDAARSRGLSAVALTTDRFVVFNYPFYRSLGFVEPETKDMLAYLRAILDAEVANGMDPERRAGMVLRLPGI
ncbi:GNAT family N-acetyltransferase [Rhizobium sp. BE258]|uniref:GNAT family N-acetyltransferase n=1 Tax=Rhizobium sp. BE258 TaxID=2817722 RepID=UPI0028563D11|nr:GNAT family N-acetyltransferase [Rhizobium sp. BE258]MDR7144104.1 GNAT superfamily N-acetyltransferase [Rhizobium sp. BE258]